jgi:hypothetical protein
MHKNIYNARHRYLIVLPKGQLLGQKDSNKLKLYPFHIKHKKGKPPKKFMKNQHMPSVLSSGCCAEDERT